MKRTLFILVALLAALATACTQLLGVTDVPNLADEAGMDEAGMGEDTSVGDGGTQDSGADATTSDHSTGDAADAGDAADVGSEAAEASGCMATELLCDGGCVGNGVRNCGTCGNDCTNLPHVLGTATCASGQCAFPASSCAPGWADCNGNPADGCEVDVTTAAHCGGCANACSTATPVCAPSGGSYACASGCPAATPTLCGTSCVDTSGNANDCKTCGNACTTTVANAVPACATSACTFTCKTGFMLCNGACVDITSDNNNCGACGAKCTGGKSCQGSSCACPTGMSDCTGTCVNLQTDSNNCKTCGTACPTGQLCVGAACQCPTGQTNCSGSCVTTSTDARHCGTCTNDCASLAHVTGTTSCTAGQCAFPASSCAPGWADCNGVATDGCEINITTAANCGGCTMVCSGGTPVCSATTGGSYACVSGCPAATPTLCSGACVDLTSNANDCKTCGTACTTMVTNASPACVMSACTFACKTGFTPCTGACSDTTSDNANCGACGTSCKGGSACQGSNCVCGTGLTMCGTGSSAACVNLQTDPNNCKTCGSACPTGQQCVSGACQCPTGLTNCGGTCLNTTSDSMHCGASCTVCTAGTTCQSGSCLCPAATHACGQCVPNDINACGPNCTKCTPPTGGSVACNGTTCAPSCPSSPSSLSLCVSGGTELCANLNTDPANCGTCGNTCQPPTGSGTVACLNGVCKQSCTTGVLCNGACITSSQCTPGTPGNACDIGCNMGGTCRDTGVAVPNGTVLTGSTCNPNIANNCNVYDFSCSGGVASCSFNTGTAQANNTQCNGASNVCCGGTCTPLGTHTNCSACGATCTAPNTCGGGGTFGQCGCTSEPDAILCAGANGGFTCGTATLTDHCGVSRARNCGTCPVRDPAQGAGCTNSCVNNVCVCPAGTPDGTACGNGGAIQICLGVCTDLSKNSTANCGGCGGAGPCTPPETCDGAGVPNKCGQCAAGQAACDDGSNGCAGPSCCISASQCTPGNPCDMGCTNIVTGGCTDTGVPVPDGTSCGTSKLCCGGTCTAKGALTSCN